MARLKTDGEKTYVHPGDPIWIIREGRDQADTGTFVEGPVDGRLRVQTGAGKEWVAEDQVVHRRPGQEPVAMKKAAVSEHDPLVRVADAIEFVIAELSAEIERTATASERARNTARSAKNEKSRQIKTLQRCLPILKREHKPRKGHKWSPEQRKAASDRMKKMNADGSLRPGPKVETPVG